MRQQCITGVYGKLPYHGDFIHRHLPIKTIEIWDKWLQHFMSTTKKELHERWLEMYLNGPIWRFAFSEGVIDEHAWLGVLLPSVDKVGRYFPMTVLTQIPNTVNVFEFFFLQSKWYESVEMYLLDALENEQDVDFVFKDIKQYPINYETTYQKNTPAIRQANMVLELESEHQEPTTILPYLLSSFLAYSNASYSIWTTAGSEYVKPCALIEQGLPKISGMTAMLDGQWSERNWQLPYEINQVNSLQSKLLIR